MTVKNHHHRPGWDADELRTRFTKALSDMYRAEVPQYGSLIEIVHQVDSSVLTAQGRSIEQLPVRHQLERHGAIRLGTERELLMIRSLFAILGMYPVGYYDLRVVGFPIHGTAFRPIDEKSLRENPFRVFTTVLRRDMLSSITGEMADDLLRKRNLFTPRLCEIMDLVETENAMTPHEADELIVEALKIFKWHSRSTVPVDAYRKLKWEHPTVADIVCFPSAHINHLTPRTLDIDLVQQEMVRHGLPAKESIEGPPRRECPILLRQTSFKALEERVDFVGTNGPSVHGTHTARFGEVEQRGAAVTRKGRQLYDQLLASSSRNAAKGSDGSVGRNLSNAFQDYPDTWAELRARGLVYFRYHVTPGGQQRQSAKSEGSSALTGVVSMEQLLSAGLVEYEPITYEDFLPLSAAGIFESNLPDKRAGAEAPEEKEKETGNGLPELERALGCRVRNEFDLYHQQQQRSIEGCKGILGLEGISME